MNYKINYKMNYEQKYKEALERAKKELNTCGSLDCDAARQIFRLFPELKESDDERIRKATICFLEYYEMLEEADHNSTEGIKECIAWLEKQSEQSNNEEAEKEKNDYVSGQFLYCKGSFNEFKEGESYWLEYVGNDNYIGRSDNILNQKFHITPRQLYTWFDPRHPYKGNAPIGYGNMC